TKTLTTNMSGFLDNIGNASSKTASSVENTVDSLNKINENLDVVREINHDNRMKMEGINHSIENIAATTQEINSSISELNEQVTHLHKESEKVSEDSVTLNEISNSLFDVIDPIGKIEGILDETTGLMGKMTQDRFYMIDNGMFIQSVNGAITAHKKWVDSLKNIVDLKETTPVQTNPQKCGFGHFYYAMNPKDKQIAEIWKEIEKKHSSLHGTGKDTMELVKKGDTVKAMQQYNKAVEMSKDLLRDFEQVNQRATELTKQEINVFD
ncbi:MAG: CZB domain-containing protein, partial [Acetivibrio sp.]